MAVGQHLLGGDNMDLLLAYEAERRIIGRNGSLNSRMMSQLVSACRDMKEHAFSPEAKASYSISLPGQGRRLIQSVRSCEFSRSEIVQMLSEAFVPAVNFNAPLKGRTGLALSALGLPYEQASSHETDRLSCAVMLKSGFRVRWYLTAVSFTPMSCGSRCSDHWLRGALSRGLS